MAREPDERCNVFGRVFEQSLESCSEKLPAIHFRIDGFRKNARGVETTARLKAPADRVENEMSVIMSVLSELRTFDACRNLAGGVTNIGCM